MYTRRASARIATVISAVSIACTSAPPPDVGGQVGARVEAISAGVQDQAATALEQEYRDAVVRLGGPGCHATLITPRLVLTAWHCLKVPSNWNQAVFGWAPDRAYPTPERIVRTVGCEVFPGARADGALPACRGFPSIPDTYDPDTELHVGFDPTVLRWPFDLALVVLGERVDGLNIPPTEVPGAQAARPMPVVLDDPGGDRNSWVGESIRLVGIIPPGFDSEAPHVPADWFRYSAPGWSVGSVGDGKEQRTFLGVLYPDES